MGGLLAHIILDCHEVHFSTPYKSIWHIIFNSLYLSDRMMCLWFFQHWFSLVPDNNKPSFRLTVYKIKKTYASEIWINIILQEMHLKMPSATSAMFI